MVRLSKVLLWRQKRYLHTRFKQRLLSNREHDDQSQKLAFFGFFNHETRLPFARYRPQTVEPVAS